MVRKFVQRVLLALLINTLWLDAADIRFVDSSDIENAGVLEKGDGVSLIPAKGYALSVTRWIKGKEGPASYDITLKSGGRVLYDQKNEKEDIYFVFNDEVEPGDIIDIFVHEGRFKYTFTKINSLPPIVLDALQKRSLKKGAVSSPLENGSKASSNKRVADSGKVARPVKKAVTKPKAKKSNHGILYGIKRALREAAEVLTGEDRKKRAKKSPVKRSIEEVLGEPVLPKKPPKKVTTPPSIPTKTEVPKAESLPKPGITAPTLSTPSITAPTIREPVSTTVTVPPAPKISPIATSPGMPVSPTPPDRRIATPDVKPMPVSTPKFENRGVHLAQRTEPMREKVEPPAFTEERPLPQIEQVPQVAAPVKRSVTQEPRIEPMKTPPSIQKPKLKQERTPPRVAPEPVVETPIKKAAPVVEKIEKPKPAPPRVEKKSDKIIITKLIDKEKYKEEPMERMSDRVLGTGYQSEERARLQVRAYSNGRPVSAWVEVIDARTNRRVKTFYTSRGQIRLPAGTYLIRATYRTLSAKQRKSLGKVRLRDGGVLKKKVYFNDGTLLVVAKRGEAPLYVKVEVFKAGSKRRVTYDFSSRRTGVAQLKIPAGRYDIVVKEHGFVKRFENVKVRGGKITSIEALF